LSRPDSVSVYTVTATSWAALTIMQHWARYRFELVKCCFLLIEINAGSGSWEHN